MPIKFFVFGVAAGVATCGFAWLGVIFRHHDRRDGYLAAPPMLLIAIMAGLVGLKYDSDAAHGFACVWAASAVALAMWWCLSLLINPHHEESAKSKEQNDD